MSNKHFFLASFLPAVAYWYLEENYSLTIALTGGIILSFIEMGIEKYFTGHVHKMSKINFYLIVGLGAISLMSQSGIAFKLQPFFTGVIMGGFLLINIKRGNSLLDEMPTPGNQKPPREVLMWMERNLGFFMIAYGMMMAGIGIYASTDTWIFFKTLGFYACFIVFMILMIVRMKFKNGKFP